MVIVITHTIASVGRNSLETTVRSVSEATLGSTALNVTVTTLERIALYVQRDTLDMTALSAFKGSQEKTAGNVRMGIGLVALLASSAKATTLVGIAAGVLQAFLVRIAPCV